jgi:transglutaminase-like putative cysteine protease
MSAEVASSERRSWALALLYWFVVRFRPHLGWGAFLGTLTLLLLPASAVRAAGWVNIPRSGVVPEWAVLIGLLTAWPLLAWWGRRTRATPMSRTGRFLLGIALFLLWILLGLLTLSQVLFRWLPSPLRLWRVATDGAWSALGADILGDWMTYGWRVGQWWQGVQTGGALQDDLIFLSFVVLFLWIITGLTAWLALRTRSGLLLALPSLWSLTLILYYGNGDRWLLLFALAVTILLHLWLDQVTLEADWQRRSIDFSPALIFDRLFVVGGITLLILLVAAVIPSPSVNAARLWAYEQLSPVYEPLESTGKRLFPDLERQPRGRYGGIGSGLPNQFLLGAGPDLGQSPVMWVSTNRTMGNSYMDFYEEPSLRFYMRRATFADYNGAGWDNPSRSARQPYPARQSWLVEDWERRAPLRQWIRMAQPSSLLYAAGEPIEPGIDYEADLRGNVDLVALWAQGGPVTRYEMISAVPSVDTEILRAWPGFGEDQPLPAELERHLRLPDTVTQRTRALAVQLVADQPTLYGKAEAIEAYLRGFTYDLDVSAPPADVVDVADYFLFDLQRGYCDYYATAFVVLARLNGLPARFVTGYVPGGWNPEAQEWLITEAEAHSWPEIYFPDLGWVAFEPTAGRAPLERVRFDSPARPLDLPVAPPAVAPEVAPDPEWNWQMLVWLVPLLGLLVLLWGWVDRRPPHDPWLALVSWGRRLGRPLQSAETELEYGRGLSDHIVTAGGEPERVRRLSRSVLDLSQAATEIHYGPADLRPPALQRARLRWQAIRRELRWW